MEGTLSQGPLYDLGVKLIRNQRIDDPTFDIQPIRNGIMRSSDAHRSLYHVLNPNNPSDDNLKTIGRESIGYHIHINKRLARPYQDSFRRLKSFVFAGIVGNEDLWQGSQGFYLVFDDSHDGIKQMVAAQLKFYELSSQEITLLCCHGSRPLCFEPTDASAVRSRKIDSELSSRFPRDSVHGNQAYSDSAVMNRSEKQLGGTRDCSQRPNETSTSDRGPNRDRKDSGTGRNKSGDDTSVVTGESRSSSRRLMTSKHEKRCFVCSEIRLSDAQTLFRCLTCRSYFHRLCDSPNSTSDDGARICKGCQKKGKRAGSDPPPGYERAHVEAAASQSSPGPQTSDRSRQKGDGDHRPAKELARRQLKHLPSDDRSTHQGQQAPRAAIPTNTKQTHIVKLRLARESLRAEAARLKQSAPGEQMVHDENNTSHPGMELVNDPLVTTRNTTQPCVDKPVSSADIASEGQSRHNTAMVQQSADLRTTDRSDTRPPYTYPQIAGMALLQAPEGLRQSAIHKWICENIPGFDMKDKDFKIGISVWLSTSAKKPDPPIRRNPREGHHGDLWCIVPGKEHLFREWDPENKIMSGFDPATVPHGTKKRIRVSSRKVDDALDDDHPLPPKRAKFRLKPEPPKPHDDPLEAQELEHSPALNAAPSFAEMPRASTQLHNQHTAESAGPVLGRSKGTLQVDGVTDLDSQDSLAPPNDACEPDERSYLAEIPVFTTVVRSLIAQEPVEPEHRLTVSTLHNVATMPPELYVPRLTTSGTQTEPEGNISASNVNTSKSGEAVDRSVQTEAHTLVAPTNEFSKIVTVSTRPLDLGVRSQMNEVRRSDQFEPSHGHKDEDFDARVLESLKLRSLDCFTATSLIDPKRNRSVPMSVIKSRLTKKQMIRAGQQYMSRLGHNKAVARVEAMKVALTRSSNYLNDDTVGGAAAPNEYGIADIDFNDMEPKRYDSLEDLIEMPKTTVPHIHEGQLCFTDGSDNSRVRPGRHRNFYRIGMAAKTR